MTKNILLTALTLLLSFAAFSQDTEKKYWVSGNARGLFYLDEFQGQAQDSTTARKSEYGHTLVDLSANIRPNKNTFIRTTLRVRNEYGGFWGSGVTFDVRELYLKGLIANSVRYQIGDIDYKLTPFTLFNDSEELYENSLDIFNMYSDMVHYDLFYTKNNTWRQQGLAADFALSFREGIDELQFNMFSSRVNFGGGATDDRILFGGNVTMVHSEAFTAGLNYINLYDIAETSADTAQYRNPVITGSYQLKKDLNDFALELNGESGISKSMHKGDDLAPVHEDFFNYAKLSAEYKPFDLNFSLAYRNVGPKFRSAGAQTRRLNYSTESTYFDRYTNNQITRPMGLWDIYNNAAVYNTQIEKGLSNYYPHYNNIDPYGLATPNRQGLDLSISRVDDENRYAVQVELGMLKEIEGEEANQPDVLKSYNSISAHTDIHVNEFIAGFDRGVLLQLGYTQNHTTSDNDAVSDAKKTDLKSERITAGLTVELSKELDFMAGYEIFTAKGFDHVISRDSYDELNYYPSFGTDLSEDIFGLGFKYKFNEKNDLQILWQDYNWSNSDYHTLELEKYDDVIEYTQDEKPDYGFGRLAVAFRMKF
jgi:hypothetical protein